MTRKEQIKILDDKIKSNINQCKIDRLNAEISPFSSGDLNKYEFLTRKDLKYKPNALDKARFEFSPLGKAFSTGLDKTAEGYQEAGVIKLLKDIRDGLAGGVNRPNRFNDNNNNNNNNNDDNNDDNRTNNLKDKILDLETKLKNSELSNEEKDKLNNKHKEFVKNIEKDMNNLDKESNDMLNMLDNKVSKLNDKIKY